MSLVPSVAAPARGVLCLTFDDSYFADWEAALPLFAEHGAHATFFAYHAVDEKSVASLRRLSDAGHSIGLHGLQHLKAPETIAEVGEEKYLADEIEPQLAACRAAGLPVRSFAYPMSRHTPETDALLLRHFDRLRGGIDFEGAFPIAEAATRRYLPGIGVGPHYKRGGAEIAAMLPAVAESNRVLVVYSHDIGETAQGVSMSRADLETILLAAEELGMAVLGFDELDTLSDTAAAPSGKGVEDARKGSAKPFERVSPEEAAALAPVRTFEVRKSDGSSESIPYRIYCPENFAPGEKVPLLFFLHGAGTRGSDGAALAGNSSFRALLGYLKSRGGRAVLLAPQCPADAQWVDTPWGTVDHPHSETPSRHMALALALLDAELTALPIDRSRIYVCGNSMGGYATWDVAARRPGLFAGALPICGGGDPAVADRYGDLPVWAFHGGADNVVPVENTRRMVAAMRADPNRTAELRYREYPGVAHDSWTATFGDAEVLDWLFAQRR